MSAATIEMLERGADALGPLIEDEVAFVGGATIALWATDQAAAEFRPTDDVDVIVGVTSRIAYYRFEERLRDLGFVNDDESGLTCRFRHRRSPSGRTIKAVPPTYLLATKLEAFKSRGEGDLLASHDFEDVITLIDRREELVAEFHAAPVELREFVAAELAILLGHRDFDSASEGALAGPSTIASIRGLTIRSKRASVSGPPWRRRAHARPDGRADCR